MEVGVALRSRSQVRLCDTLGRRACSGAHSFGCGVAGRVESVRGEGESPTVELVDLGGGEGQESIGFSGCLTVPGGERLLNRSKALESGSLARRSRLRWSGAEPVDASLGVLC
jgi:hypothetical protein